MKSRFILVLIFIIFSNSFVNAADDVQVDIKSINKLEKVYAAPQKIQLHLDFAKLYAENSKWWNYYKHLRDIFNACPEIKRAKIIMINHSNRLDSEIKSAPVDPYIVKRLNKLGVRGVENQQQALEYLKLLKPICDIKCVKPDEKKFLKHE